jgi:hypothetical protein
MADFGGSRLALGWLKMMQEYGFMSTQPYGTIFEPSDLRSLGLAFDEAWDAVAPHFVNAESHVLAQARGRLATIMMELAKEAQLEADDIKRLALDRFRESLGNLHGPHEAAHSLHAATEGPQASDCH